MNFTIAWRTLQGMLRGMIASIPNIIIAIIVLIISYLVARGIRRLVERFTERRKRARNLGLVLGRLSQGAVILLGLLIGLLIIFPSFNVADLIQLLGISGVAIGFAFRDILQNFLAGILLLLTQPFFIGDQIVANSFEGTVEDIQTRATTIRTYDGRRIVIPNTNLFTQPVTVNTALDKRRLGYDIRIDINNDVEKTKGLMVNAMNSVEGILKDPAPDALLADLVEGTLTIRVLWWIQPPRRAEAMYTQDKVLIAIQKTLVENSINLPVQTQQILLQKQQAGAVVEYGNHKKSNKP